jgi:hypothetical protein
MTLLLSALRRPRSVSIALLTLGGVLACTGVYRSHAQAVAASSTALPALPSGLSPVSQLGMQGFQLALDSNGALFRSDGPGKRWRLIRQQWQGKAVELLGMPPLTAAPKSGQTPRTDANQEQYAAVLLRSTTALHWVSVDQGKTWTPSTLDDVRRNDVAWSAPAQP